MSDGYRDTKSKNDAEGTVVEEHPIVEKGTGNRTGRSRGIKFVKLAGAAIVLLAVAGQATHLVRQRIDLSEPATILPARIRAARTYSVTAEVSGSVTSLLVAAGDTVTPGQELARIESSELTTLIEQARDRVARAQNRRNSIVAKTTAGRAAKGAAPEKDLRDELNDAQYQAALRAWEGARSRLQQHALSEIASNHQHVSARVKNAEELLARKLATSAELDRARAEEQQSLRNLQAAREHRSRLQQEADAALAHLRMVSMQNRLQDNSESDNARAEFEDAAARLEALTSRTNQLVITAKKAGTVISISVPAGERVTAGAALFQIADLSELAVEVPVTAKVARQVRRGERVSVRLPLDPPREIEALISNILLEPDGRSHPYLVRIMIANPEPHAILAGLEGAVIFPHSGKDRSWARLLF